MLEGYQKWAKENWFLFPKKLSLEGLLLIQLIPEYFNWDNLKIDKTHPFAKSVACTSLVEQGPEGPLFARNLDWPSFGLLGAYSCVINRRYADGRKLTLEVGVPGFIGTLTGMNEDGLSLSMNIAHTSERPAARGIPAGFLNRYCLENYSTSGQVQTAANGPDAPLRPFGPYHLTVADPDNAFTLHFYQRREHDDTYDRVDHLFKQQPLAILNGCFHRHDPDPSLDPDRNRELKQFFAARNNRPLEAALKLPSINNWDTTHSVVMHPRSRSFKLVVDNAFAADAPLRTLDTSHFFIRAPAIQISPSPSPSSAFAA